MVNKKRSLLIYAHYYVPDTASTGQILRELAEGLLDQFEVTVICVVPSYIGTIEDKYKSKKYYFENINGVNVVRVKVPEFKKDDKLSRIKNILTYFFRAMSATWKVGEQDYVLAVSQPPILGGLLGVWGKWIKTAKYIYQIQDLNPEQIEAVGYFKFKPLLWVLKELEKFSCKKSDLIITVGRDLVEQVKRRFNQKKGINKHIPNTVLINNWIDENEIYPLSSNDEGYQRVVDFRKKYGLEDKFVIAYSGNLGHYYDLLELLKVIEKFKPGTRTGKCGKQVLAGTKVKPEANHIPNNLVKKDFAVGDSQLGQEVIFTFIGAGSLLEPMKSFCEQHHMTNVVFISYQPMEDLIYSLNAADIQWCVNAKGIKGVSCPSKYYGIAAVGEPVLGVLEKGSEIRCIIEETNGGLVCEPGNYLGIEKNLKWFIDNADSQEVRRMGARNREYLVENLTRTKSIGKYAEEILKL